MEGENDSHKGPHEKDRPTCVTVIGWFWIVVGGMFCLNAAMGLLLFQWSRGSPMPTIVKAVPLIALLQGSAGALGLVAGVNFLKLRAKARTVLECLTWLFLFFMVGLLISWIGYFIHRNANQADGLPVFFMVFAGIIPSVITAVPLGIVLMFLRGKTVKEAMRPGRLPAITQ
jgi:apolipoprotein N-acyltransferase